MQNRILSREQLEGVARVNLLRKTLGLSLEDVEKLLARPTGRKVLSDEQRRGLIFVRGLMKRWSVPLAEVEALLGEQSEGTPPTAAAPVKTRPAKEPTAERSVRSETSRPAPARATTTTPTPAATVRAVVPAARPVETAAAVPVAPKAAAQLVNAQPAAMVSTSTSVQQGSDVVVKAAAHPQPPIPPLVAKRPGVIVTTAKPLPPRTDPAPGSRQDSAASRMSSPYGRDMQRKKAIPGDADYVKFRHPVTGQTWNGMGKQPGWIAQAFLFDGLTFDQLKPDNQVSGAAQKDSARVVS
jgi:hypothetical protein